MDFNLRQAVTGREPRSLVHLPLTGREVVQIGGNNERLNSDGQRTVQSLLNLTSLTGSWKVYFLECLQGVILRNGMRHLEAARWHTNLVRKREKQADRIGMRAAALLARKGR
jgi:hypothetical protein